jgi:hypothetical protein
LENEREGVGLKPAPATNTSASCRKFFVLNQSGRIAMRPYNSMFFSVSPLCCAYVLSLYLLLVARCCFYSPIPAASISA